MEPALKLRIHPNPGISPLCTVICGALSCMAVNLNTLYQPISVHRFKLALIEGGAIPGDVTSGFGCILICVITFSDFNLIAH